MADKQPAAFLSYVRFDDAHDEGRITELCKSLAHEVETLTGEEFHIFQDRDIKWGEQWQRRLDNSVEAATFLIPIVSPKYFKRPACRDEYKKFIAHEKARKRDDLVLPIYYVETRELENDAARKADDIAVDIAARQRADWRQLRHEPTSGSEFRRALTALAEQIRDRIWAETPVKPSAPKRVVAKRPKAAKTARPAGAGGASGKEAKADGAATYSAPRTIVVDQFHHGDFTTITEAITKAEPGTRILVKPGNYTEGLVIDKPLEIVGDGPREDIVVEALESDVILFKATIGRVSGLTLRQGGGKFYAVRIPQGRLELEDCTITCAGISCVAIYGRADPRIRKNTIHDSNEAGVIVFENGRGTIEDNVIVGSSLAGIEIADKAYPTVRRNRISGGKQSGVHLHEEGRGIIEDNDIVDNRLTGCSVKEKARATVLRNRINRNWYQAVYVYSGGGGIFESNDLRDNKEGPWNIKPDCLANVQRSGNTEE